MRILNLQLGFLRVFSALTVASLAAILPSTAAEAAVCHFYEVNLQGTTSIPTGAQQFSVGQYAMWRDTGVRGNTHEFWLFSLNDLNASAQVGQITFMTNSIFANNLGIRSAGLDLARTGLSNNAVIFQLDSGASLQLPSPNVFVAPGVGNVLGGLGGLGFLPGAGVNIANVINGAQVLSVSFLVPRQGTGYFFVNGDVLGGEIQVTGSPPDNLGFEGTYAAQINGRYIGSMQCN